VIAPQKLDKGNTKMTDINEENKDLIENKIPFGLLDHETQERLRAWPHGWQLWIEDFWTDIASSSQFGANPGYVFRAKPEPEPEPVEVLHEVSITVESPLLDKEMHFKLTFDAKLDNPTIEAIE
jgi:hypothetical protein